MSSASSSASEPTSWMQEVDSSIKERVEDFEDPRQEWRRLVSEVVGTFLLVVAAAGAPMVGAAYPGTVGLAMAVTAPALTVLAVILFMGKVSGAHLNPAVSCAFAPAETSRGAGYRAMSSPKASARFFAALVLRALTNVSSTIGGSYPGANTSSAAALITEMLLTFGLVSVILGTASGAQNVGLFAAVGVAGYITLAGLWAAPLSGHQ